jgi:hypothetical protein
MLRKGSVLLFAAAGNLSEGYNQTFHTAIRSLALSQLPIEKLNIFNDRRLQSCSLACNELGRINFEHKGLSISLASLKSLSISFLDTVIYRSTQNAGFLYDPNEGVDLEIDTQARDRDDLESGSDDSEASDHDVSIADAGDEHKFTVLARLLRLSGQLEDLELHQCSIRAKILRRRGRLFKHIVEIHTPQKLKRLELRGLAMEEQDLLVFIQRAEIRELSMYNTTLSSGTFRSIFDYCTSSESGMDRLYFMNLVEQQLLVYFQGPKNGLAEPWLNFDRHPFCSNMLERRGADIQHRISYQPAPSVYRDTNAHLREQELIIEYGPLTIRGHAFRPLNSLS